MGTNKSALAAWVRMRGLLFAAGIIGIGAWTPSGESAEPGSPVIDPHDAGSSGISDFSFTDLDQEASEPGGRERVTEKLATHFGVEHEQIAKLHHEGWSFGEIDHALRVAATMPGGITGENLETVRHMRQQQQMGWGQIAQELHTTMGHLTGQGHQAPGAPAHGAPGSEPESPVHAGASTTTGRSMGGASHGVGHDAGSFGSHGGGSGGPQGVGHGAGGVGAGPGHGGASTHPHGQSGSASGHNR
jgi:hypothetical protein